MKAENVIKAGVNNILKGAQFRRKSTIWYRDMGEVVLVVDLQKSSFGEQYYVNLGVFVKGLPANREGKLPPKENECHIRLRLEALRPEAEEQLKQMLNLEDCSIGTPERQQRIEETVAHTVLPFLLQCGTLAGIRNAHRQGHLDHALVHKSVRDSVFS